MAGLYDKIRKKKKENLEAIYKADQPKSMAEAVAKFKNVNSKAAYGGGEALADPAAAVQGGDAIKSKSKSEPCEEVDGVLMNTETGEPCVSPKDKLEDMTESRDDVNPDADEDGGGLFGRKKGGTKVGNFLRSVVGKKSYELMNASPFHNEEDNGEGDPLENNEGGGGTSKGTVSINDELYNIDINAGTTGSSTDPEGGNCPPGMVLGKDGICVIETEVDPSKGNMPDDKWIKFCDENPCNAACHAQYGKCTEKPTGGKCPDGSEPDENGKCVTKGSDASADLNALTDVEETPAEGSQNLTFGTQLLNNWGQNLLEGRQGRRDSKDIRSDKRGFTPKEQDLYNEARKSLRQSGDLPGRADQIKRQRAIYDKMNELSIKAGGEGGYGGQGFDVGGSKMSISEIARDIRTGRLQYDSDDIQNLPYEVKEKIRDLSDNQGRTDYNQYSEKKEEEVARRGEGNLDNMIPEEIRNQGPEAIKKYIAENPDKFTNNSPDKKLFSYKMNPRKPSNIKFGIGESIMKKKSGFSLKRGKLNRPGY